MPYFCHVHNGLYESIEGEEGCQSEPCVALRAKKMAPMLVFGSVPGGTRAASVAKLESQKFHQDMDAYKRAVDNGLNPEMVSKEAVEKEERRLYKEEQWR